MGQHTSLSRFVTRLSRTACPAGEPFRGIWATHLWATRLYEQGSKMREQVASGGGEAGGDKLKVG